MSSGPHPQAPHAPRELPPPEPQRRLQQVEAELDARLQAATRRERARQRLLTAASLAALGLIGALAAMFLTRPPRLAVLAHEDPQTQDLAADDASATLAAMRAELEQMRRATAREHALLDAAAARLPGPRAQPSPPRPPRAHVPQPPRQPGPKPPRIKVCKDLDDPLAEDC